MSGPQVRLRAFREERGWTQRDVAEHVQRLAWAKHADHVGVNADMVAKWERGAKGVSPYYRELLAILFGVEPRLLGLLTSARGPEVVAGFDELARGASELLDRLGPAADVIRAHVVQVIEDQVARRRTLLAVMGLQAMSAEEPSPGAMKATSARFEDLSARYQELYHSSDPVELLTIGLAHLSAVTVAARGASGEERARLISNQARCATLVGRLAFFDLDDAMSARGHYAVAAEAAHEAGDTRQRSAAMAHLAFVPAAEGSPAAALEYLAAAREALTHEPHPRLSSWLDAVESEILANDGNHAAALAAIDRARDAMLFRSTKPSPLVRLLRPDPARRLRRLRHPPRRPIRLRPGRPRRGAQSPPSRREAAIGLPRRPRDGALPRRRPRRGLPHRDYAVDELARAGYATGAERVRAFRRLVRPQASSLAVRTLDEQSRP